MTINTQNSIQEKIAEEFLATHSSAELQVKVTSAPPTKIEGYTLNATRKGDVVHATIGIALDHSLRYALNRLISWAATSEVELYVDEGPDFAVRGVVEGFYGKPWSHVQRMRGISYFGDYNMNTYFLAPKDIPWQRFNWRSPFDADFLSSTSELIEQGKKNAIDVVVWQCTDADTRDEQRATV